MTSSNDTPAPLKRTNAEAPDCAPVAEKPLYRAFEESRLGRRHLEIRLKPPQPSESPSYATLTNIIHEWRMGQALILEYARTMVVTIEGRNLTPIYRALKEWRVEWIAEFNPDDYAPPTDQDAPFIESISVTTNRPEMPTPVKRFH